MGWVLACHYSERRLAAATVVMVYEPLHVRQKVARERWTSLKVIDRHTSESGQRASGEDCDCRLQRGRMDWNQHRTDEEKATRQRERGGAVNE